MTSTDIDLDTIEAAADAATPGPWTADSSIPYGHRVGSSDQADWVAWTGEHGETGSEADAAFIAALNPVVAKTLVAEIRRLRALLPQPVIVPDKGTPLSDYDFVELVAFASKVKSEGFGYAFEEYPPHFESPEFAPVAGDYSLLRQLYDEWEEALDGFWTRLDAGAVYDAHIDEARRRRREQRAAVVPAAGVTGE